MGHKRPRSDPLTKPSGSSTTNDGQTTKRAQVSKNSPDQEQSLQGGRSNGYDPTGQKFSQRTLHPSLELTLQNEAEQSHRSIVWQTKSVEISDVTKTI